MSKVYATFNGFVGHNGQSVWLAEGDEYDAGHPLVKAQPQHFTTATPAGVVVAEHKAARKRTSGSNG